MRDSYQDDLLPMLVVGNPGTRDHLADPDVPNRWGAMFNAAYKEGLIEPVGFAYSRRPTRSGGICRVWRGVSKEVAA